MRTQPEDRKRYVSEPVSVPQGKIVAGLARIAAGVWGLGNPRSGLAMEQVSLDPEKSSGFYHVFEGDLFTPGTGNWVVEPTHDGPVNMRWGHGFLRNPNTFNPIQSPQVYSAPASQIYGIGGLIAGQIITQPLSEPAAQ